MVSGSAIFVQRRANDRERVWTPCLGAARAMRHPRRSAVVKKGGIVRLHATCSMGHSMHGGEWALFLKVGWMRSTLCQQHAKALHGYEPPIAQETNFEPDAKTRSTGE